MLTKTSAVNYMSSLQEVVVHHFSRTRYRTRLFVGFALVLLSLYCLSDTSGMSSMRSRLSNIDFTRLNLHGAKEGNSTRPGWIKPHPGHLIPPKIWQIMLPKSSIVKNSVEPDIPMETATWLAMNQGYSYTLVGEDWARDFLHRHFSHNATIISTFDSLPNVGMKSDFLRYLLLYVEGGVYTDIDTLAIRPIDEWVPTHFRNQTRLIAGIEFDRRDGPQWVDIPHDLQFCQWTIAAAPGHPVFLKMISRVIRSLEELTRMYTEAGYGSTWQPTSFEVMTTTGPAAWTDMVWEYLQETDERLTDLRNLSYLAAPSLFGDALILPINAFGMMQLHSGSIHDGSIPDDALVQHLFTGSWRENWGENVTAA